MLQQILRDLYVDPVILAGLDDQQKQTLFCKMREEQVRRWTLWNEKLGDEPSSTIKSLKKKKNVSFLLGSDGEAWVWVMGEHKDDKSIEIILKEEAIEKARAIAEQEAEELRKQLTEYMDLAPKIQPQVDNDMDIYCSVDELREKINNKPQPPIVDHYYNEEEAKLKTKFGVLDSREVLQEISKNTQKVAQRVALWEKRLTEERTCEILKKIQKKQQQVEREAEEDEMKQDQLWKEQERKAKEAELQIREIARRAREEHRLTSNFEIDTCYSTTSLGQNNKETPPNRSSVIDWFKKHERARMPRLEPWFHGLITRSEAEHLLLDCDYGTFLMRLSEKIWGYVISYRARDKCKHYLVSSTASGKYQFLGNNQIEHDCLSDLIEYHKLNPLTGGENLIKACPRNFTVSLDELVMD